MIALCFTALFLNQKSFFQKGTTQTAIAVYILVVALIYNTVLRGIVNPQGFDRIVDELLHVIMPVIFLIYWFIYTDKQPLQFRNVLPWLIYPLLYMVFTLIRGSFVHFYPYPFIDVDKFGYQKALINCIWVSFAFVVISLLFIAIGRAMVRNKAKQND